MSFNNNFNFFDVFKNFTDGSAYTKMYKCAFLNNMGSDNFKRGNEVAMAVAQSASDNFQAIAKHNAEYVQRGVADAMSAVKDAFECQNAEQLTKNNHNFVQHSVENFFGNARDMVEMGARSFSELLGIMSNGYKYCCNQGSCCPQQNHQQQQEAPVSNSKKRNNQD